MINRAYCKILYLLATALLVSACSSFQPQVNQQPNIQPNTPIENWQLRGKLGIRNGKRADSVYINWTQCQGQFNIRITGPFGQGAARLFGSNQLVTFENNKQQRFYADSPEKLLQQQLGWSLPVSQLYYWLRALPSPTSEYIYSDNQTDFSQQHWQISFPRFETVNNYHLPTKIIAEQAPLKVTFLIKQWQLQACELTP